MTEQQPAILYLYDTFRGEKREFEPLEPGHCRVYCCGPTVYDMSHIGHARAALVPDLLVRYLRFKGFKVTYARNVTDIDDNIIRRANKAGKTSTEIARCYTQYYREDLQGLGMLTPDIEPQVTGHINEIIDMISKLIDGGYAYCVDGDVYYQVHKFPKYGQLSKRKLEDMQAGARVEVDSRKRDPMDFALWKAAKPDEPAWSSPWGSGRPGWHIECSAMSCKHLGSSFDIHTGGRDLIFPHHENEIAQSQAVCGADSYARYWIHNGFVNFAGEKMSKSLGNFFTIREVIALYHPEVLRYYLMGVHYRSPINLDVEVKCPKCQAVLDESDQKNLSCRSCNESLTREGLRQQVRFPGLEETDDRVTYMYETLAQAQKFAAAQPAKDEDSSKVSPSVVSMLERVDVALRDDLNSAAGLAELSEATSEVNRLLGTKKGVDKQVRRQTIARFVRDMQTIGTILGTINRDPKAYLEERKSLKARRIGLDMERVERLVQGRMDARNAKDWTQADALRAELEALGVRVRDDGSGSNWTI